MKKILPLLALLVSLSASAKVAWLTDLEEAKKAAAKEKKAILVDFTGSDWCGYCIMLHKEVFDKPEFEKFAKDYILVELDFPHSKPLSAAKKAKNAEAQAKFDVHGFPTVIILSATGEELGRQTGYTPKSGPKVYLDKIGGFKGAAGDAPAPDAKPTKPNPAKAA
ncbi:MAG: thioredoxin family protein [Verrucomicrobiota bacterium]|jgi:protein disulfide-isomerase